MLVLKESKPQDLADFGRKMLNTNRDGLASFEEAAQVVVNTLYREIRQPNGDPLFAMVRIFRLGSYDDLHPDLKAEADPNIERWMALTATVGVEQDWCDRRLSEDHQLIPADMAATPMMRAAFDQIGLTFGKNTLPPKEDADGYSHYFHVLEALGSPYIPDQNNFVIPYEIQSVFGFGHVFSNYDSYLCLGFSKTRIIKEEMDKFVNVAPFIGTLLAIYDAKQLWS